MDLLPYALESEQSNLDRTHVCESSTDLLPLYVGII